MEMLEIGSVIRVSWDSLCENFIVMYDMMQVIDVLAIKTKSKMCHFGPRTCKREKVSPELVDP